MQDHGCGGFLLSLRPVARRVGGRTGIHFGGLGWVCDDCLDVKMDTRARVKCVGRYMQVDSPWMLEL
jgi:hypothetical protein